MNTASPEVISDLLESRQALFTLRAPSGETFELFADGRCIGFLPATLVANRAAPLIDALLASARLEQVPATALVPDQQPDSVP